MGMGMKILVELDGDLEGQGGAFAFSAGASWLVCRIDHRCLLFRVASADRSHHPGWVY